MWPTNEQLVSPQEFPSLWANYFHNFTLLRVVWNLCSLDVWWWTRQRKHIFGSYCSSATLQLTSGRVGEPADFSHCYRVNIGGYSLLSYLGSLPRSMKECLCSWQGTNNLLANQALSWECAKISVVKLEFKCFFCYFMEKHMYSFFYFLVCMHF